MTEWNSLYNNWMRTVGETSNDNIAWNGRVLKAYTFIAWLYLFKKYNNCKIKINMWHKIKFNQNVLKHKAGPFPIKIYFELK